MLQEEPTEFYSIESSEAKQGLIRKSVKLHHNCCLDIVKTIDTEIY